LALRGLYAERCALRALYAERLTLCAFVPSSLFCIYYCLLPLSSFLPPCLCVSAPFLSLYAERCALDALCLRAFVPFLYSLLPLSCPIFINFTTLNFTCWQQNHHFSNALGIVGIQNLR
jgi:hypothetical protein